MKVLSYVMEYINIFMEKSWKCHGNSFPKMRGHPGYGYREKEIFPPEKIFFT